jgi:hypothetical protein
MKLMKYEMVICWSEEDDCYIDTNFTKFIEDHRHFLPCS